MTVFYDIIIIVLILKLQFGLNTTVKVFDPLYGTSADRVKSQIVEKSIRTLQAGVPFGFRGRKEKNER